MKRKTAVKRSKALLNDYRERLGKDKKARLETYGDFRTGQACPLCCATRSLRCCSCIEWPGKYIAKNSHDSPCLVFKYHVNNLKTRHAKLMLIDELEQRLDEWEAQDG